MSNGNNGKMECRSEPPSFCVSLTYPDPPARVMSDRVEDFIETVGRADISWVNSPVCDLKEDALRISKEFGFSSDLVMTLLSDSDEADDAEYEDDDTEMGIKIPVIRASALDVHTYPLLILIKKNFILTLHTKEVVRLKKFSRYAETFMRKIPPNALPPDRITMVLHRILSENNERNFDGLRTIEDEADKMSKQLADPTVSRQTLARDIYQMKHALISYLDALWSTLDVMHSLRYGDADLITDDPALLARLESLVIDIRGQISLSEHMSEVLASGLEVLQSIYNNQLQIMNNRLSMVITWLTILGTAVLVPNTLATIFSNPAYQMGPEDAGWYSALMVGSTIFATVITAFILYISGWLPKKVE